MSDPRKRAVIAELRIPWLLAMGSVNQRCMESSGRTFRAHPGPSPDPGAESLRGDGLCVDCAGASRSRRDGSVEAEPIPQRPPRTLSGHLAGEGRRFSSPGRRSRALTIKMAETRVSALRTGWLTRDYLPAVNPYIRWIWTPLGSLSLATVASALCGLVLHPQVFLIVFGLLTVLGIGTVCPWLAVRGLAGSLGLEKDRVREGDAVTARLVLRNRMPWSAWGLVIDDGFAQGVGKPQEAGVPVAPGFRTTTVTWTVVPGCRGVYPLQTPRVATGFPFGLWDASRHLSVPACLLVWPRTFAVGPIPEAAAGRSAEGLTLRNKPGPAGDVSGVRPYRRGDSLRRIHWAQTARHDRLVICETQSHAVPWVQVVLDTHNDVHAGSGPNGSREWAIRVAASFLEDWIGQGAEVELVCDGLTVTSGRGSVRARRGRVLDALAGIGPNGTRTLSDLLELRDCRQFRGGLRVIVTSDLGLSRLPERAERGLRERFVVLKASAFGDRDEARTVEPLSVSPWIWIDDADRVSRCVRVAWREVAIGC